MYLGLCTGHLLSASLLLAITELQLQRKWHGMRCCDIPVKTQPQADEQCSPTSPRSRSEIRSTEVMCIVHVYSTYLPNALHHGYCTETGPTGGFNQVRQPAKGRATGTQHLRAILSLPGDGDDQTTGISTNEALHINVTNVYTYPRSIETMQRHRLWNLHATVSTSRE